MYQHSEKSQQMLEKLERFFDQHIYPNEAAYAQQLHNAENRFASLPLMEELKLKAQAAGLWNLFVPPSHAEYCSHGGLSFAEYAPLVGRLHIQYRRTAFFHSRPDVLEQPAIIVKRHAWEKVVDGMIVLPHPHEGCRRVDPARQDNG